jgi:hypothetical protein
MKKIVVIYFVLLAFNVRLYAQNSSVTNENKGNAKLTEIMIKKYYSEEQHKELRSNSAKMKLLDYWYSSSFELVKGQTYTDAQVEKIDVIKLDLKRTVDKDVTFFDETSGLNLVLFSFNKMDADKSKIDATVPTLKSSLKKSAN